MDTITGTTNTDEPVAYKFNYQFSKKCKDDYKFKYSQLALTDNKLPNDYIVKDIPKITYNQGQLGSCTANSSGYMMMHLDKQPLPYSRLFQYYNTRLLMGAYYINQDAGGTNRDAVRALVKFGIPLEKDYTYQDTGTKFREKPGSGVYTKALPNVAKTYLKLNNKSVVDLKTCIAKDHVFILGFQVPQNFQTAAFSQKPWLKYPGRSKPILGGHSVACVGYIEKTDGVWFIIQNSWGEGWGEKGRCYFHESFITSEYCDDFWTVTS